MSQVPTQNFEEVRERTPEQPRHWDAWGEAWRQGTPTPVGDTSLPPTPQRQPEMQETEMEDVTIGEGQRPQGDVSDQVERGCGNTKGAPRHLNHLMCRSSLHLEGCP